MCIWVFARTSFMLCDALALPLSRRTQHHMLNTCLHTIQLPDEMTIPQILPNRFVIYNIIITTCVCWNNIVIWFNIVIKANFLQKIGYRTVNSLWLTLLIISQSESREKLNRITAIDGNKKKSVRRRKVNQVACEQWNRVRIRPESRKLVI